MKKFIIFTIIISALTSCMDDWLEDTQDLTFRVSGIESTDDLEKQLIGAYFILSSDHNAIQDSPALVYEIMSDNVSFLTDNPDFSDGARKVYQRLTADDDVDWITSVWLIGYKVANSASLPLTFVEKNGRPEDEKADQLDRILGEAHFLRAFAHFTMVRLFAPPYDASTLDEPAIVLKKEASQSGIGHSLSNVGDVYDFIIEDLQKAIELLPEKYIADFHPMEYETPARVKRDAARFLLAKVYFQMGQNATVDGENAWELASELMTTIIDNPEGIDKRPYSLGEPKDIWKSYSNNATPDELVWEYINLDWKNQKAVQVFMANKSSITGFKTEARSCPVSKNFLSAAGWETPFSGLGLIDKRFQQLYLYLLPINDKTPGTYFQSLEEPYIWANMFAGYAGSGVLTGYKVENGKRVDLSRQECNINTPFFRIGELRLLRATIFAKIGNGDPKTDMDAIINRAGIISEIQASYSLEDIILEHRRETAFEGKRLNYLKALRMDIPAGDPPGEHNNIQREDLPWNSAKLYWPIPKDEKIRNPNL